MAAVTFDDVSRVYDGDPAVNHLSLEVADGEFLVLVGPSGCGKSTTLRMLAGLEPVSSGRILIGDRVVTNLAARDRDIAMVFQSYALYPHMTVAENMSFGLKVRKTPKAEITKRVKEAADILDIERLLDRRPRQLSGGQRQRVALGRAIVRDPAVFLLDEPLSNLDASLRVQTRTELSKLHQRLGTTFIYVTHDQVEAMTMATRIAVLDRGILQQVGTPEELYERPANRFVAGFIGSPAMNFLEVDVQESGEGLALTREGLTIPLDPARAAALKGHPSVTLGIRPEHLYDERLTPSGIETTPLRTTVDVTEPLGNETFVHVTLPDGARLLARLDPRTRATAGQPITLGLAPTHLHLFHAETGASL